MHRSRSIGTSFATAKDAAALTRARTLLFAAISTVVVAERPFRLVLVAFGRGMNFTSSAVYLLRGLPYRSPLRPRRHYTIWGGGIMPLMPLRTILALLLFAGELY